MSLNNEPYMTRPILIDLNPNDLNHSSYITIYNHYTKQVKRKKYWDIKTVKNGEK